MAVAHLVHVAEDSVENLNWGLSKGRWAFSASVKRRPDIDAIALDDLVLFGWGVNPRGGGKLDGWQSRELAEAHLARVVRLPFENLTPFWPDEIKNETVRWNPTIEIELVRSFDHVSLERGRWLSFDATEAYYRAGVSNRIARVLTDGSPLLDDLPASVLRPQRIGFRSPVQEGAPPSRRTAGARVVALERLQVERARVNARTATTADPAESRLVHAYADVLRARGDDVGRLMIPFPDGETIFSDLFSRTLRLLVEAKSSVSRDHIRTAIGQLLDYGRYCESSSRVVLVPERPKDDLLDLLTSVEIDAVWRDGTGFADTRGGLYC